MTLNGVMALISRYFTEFVYDVVVKKFTFVISSPDEFLVCNGYNELAFLCNGTDRHEIRAKLQSVSSVEAGSPPNAMWPGPRPICMPSFILIHPTVWVQYTNVTDRTDRQKTDG